MELMGNRSQDEGARGLFLESGKYLRKTLMDVDVWLSLRSSVLPPSYLRLPLLLSGLLIHSASSTLAKSSYFLELGKSNRK